MITPARVLLPARARSYALQQSRQRLGPRRCALCLRCAHWQLHRFSRLLHRPLLRHQHPRAVRHRLHHSGRQKRRRYRRLPLLGGVSCHGKWVPVDISEADKHPELADYYFGHHPANRLEPSRGRDITVKLAPKAGPFNYFFARTEVNGKEVPVKATSNSSACPHAANSRCPPATLSLPRPVILITARAPVTAFTGNDPDRLPEEKQRGITIDLPRISNCPGTARHCRCAGASGFREKHGSRRGRCGPRSARGGR